MPETATAAEQGQAEVAATPAAGDTQGAAVQPPVQQTDAAQGGQVDSAAQEELVPTDDVKESWNNLSPEVKKIVNAAYTKARQRDSQKLKEDPGRRLYEALETNPVATYEWLTGQLKERGLLPANGQPPQPVPLAPQTEEVFGKLTEHFGPDAAQLLRQAFTAELQREVAPLKQGVTQVVAESTLAQSQAIRAGFEAKHPGALEKYQTKMSELALQLTDGGRIPPKMPPDQWLDQLYRLTAFDDLIGAEAQKLVNRMQQSAQNVDKPGNAVPSSRVAKKAPSLDDFKGDMEAYGRAAGEAALRGDAWE